MIRENPNREEALKNQLSKMHNRFAKVSQQRDDFARLINSLANIIINGEITSNDLDLANDAFEQVLPYLIDTSEER